MENKLITVAVPVYNMKKYLERAVGSLLAQTYQNYEILLVDDGSTDGSGAMCDGYEKKHENIRVIHKPNGGLSSARNAGIDNAQGEYIIFPDPDDWVEKEYLQTLIQLHKKYQSDIEICGHYVVEGDKKKAHNPCAKEQLLGKDEAIRILMLPTGFCGFAPNKLYHMDIIKENKLYFDIELGMAQDLHFAFRYIMNCETIAYDPVPLYNYYQHAGGVTNINAPLSARKISGLKTYEKIADIARDEFPEAERAAYSTLANMSVHFMYIYYNTKTDDKALLQMLRENFKKYKDYFFNNTTYSTRHKLLGRIALISPRLYYMVKKIFSRFIVTKE